MIAVAAPRPPVGGITCAASPMAVTRRGVHGAMRSGSAARKRNPPSVSGWARRGSSTSWGRHRRLSRRLAANPASSSFPSSGSARGSWAAAVISPQITTGSGADGTVVPC